MSRKSSVSAPKYNWQYVPGFLRRQIYADALGRCNALVYGLYASVLQGLNKFLDSMTRKRLGTPSPPS